jgi:hypothetical protein
VNFLLNIVISISRLVKNHSSSHLYYTYAQLLIGNKRWACLPYEGNSLDITTRKLTFTLTNYNIF